LYLAKIRSKALTVNIIIVVPASLTFCSCF